MRVRQRVARLEGPLPGGHLPPRAVALATTVAMKLGLDPEQVVREMEVVLAEAAAAGALGSTAALVAFVAHQTGRTPEAILVEAQRLVAR